MKEVFKAVFGAGIVKNFSITSAFLSFDAKLVCQVVNIEDKLNSRKCAELKSRHLSKKDQ